MWESVIAARSDLQTVLAPLDTTAGIIEAQTRLQHSPLAIMAVAISLSTMASGSTAAVSAESGRLRVSERPTL